MLKNFISQQEFQDETLGQNRIPEKRKRGRPRLIPKAERTEEIPNKSISINNLQELDSSDNKNKAAHLEEYLSNMSTEITVYRKKRQNQSDEDEKAILDVMPHQTNINLDAMPTDKNMTKCSEDAFEMQSPQQEADLDSNFDSPYIGDDKNCLDILEEDLAPYQESQSLEDARSFNKKGFAILDKNFTFGNEYSPNLQKKNTFDDLSSWDALDHLDIDLPERKIENNGKENVTTENKLFSNEKLEGEASHQLFDDLMIPAFKNFSQGGELNHPNKENQQRSSYKQNKMEEEYEPNLPSGEKMTIEINNSQIFGKTRNSEGKHKMKDRDNFLSLFPDKYHSLKEDAKSHNREDFYDIIEDSDKLSALDAMIKKLVKSQNNMEASDLSMMQNCYRTDGYANKHFEEQPQAIASRETMSSIEDRNIREVQKEEKKGYEYEDIDLDKLKQKIQEKKVYKLIRGHRPVEDRHKPTQTRRKKTSIDDSSIADSEDDTNEIEEDDLDRAFEEKLKKKIKHDKMRGIGSKSTTCELERNRSDGLISQKGITSTKDNQKSENFYSDFPRRSLREKKDPKSYDKKIDDFGFTFVEYKSYKPQKIKVIISFKALLMMNIHAHLSTLEVIGILGGLVVSEDEIWIKEAVPCKNISESSNTHSVEMDPTSQFAPVESQEQLERMGYKTLGWYHSHPTFKSIPSQIDQETHLTHQIHYKDHHYIGVIIGPYEKPTSKKGEIFVFHVAGTQTYKLNFMIEPTQSLSQYDIEEIYQEKVIYDYRQSEKIVKFKEKWKKGTSYQEKIMSCMRTLLEENLEDLQLHSEKNESIPALTEDADHVDQIISANEEENRENGIPLDSKVPIENFLRSFETLLQ